MTMSTDYNPMEVFQKWFYEAEHNQESEVNAMTLMTLGLDGFPKSRIVLLKYFSWEGFTFFTNYNSEKGKSIEANPRVSIIFHWVKSRRYVSIEGLAEYTSRNISEGYFESRPRGSNLSCWVSQQSDIIASRDTLERKLDYYEKKFEGKEIPKPEYWGGYIIRPSSFEFVEKYNTKNSSHESYTMDKDYNWVKRTL